MLINIITRMEEVNVESAGKRIVEFMGEVGLAITYALVSIGWYCSYLTSSERLVFVNTIDW